MKILIVEDSVVYASLIKANIQKHLLFAQCDLVSSFEELKNIKKDYDLYIVDYVLRDTKDDEHIEYLAEKNKKIILMTQFAEKFSKEKWNNKIVDFIIKEDMAVINYLIKLIKRLYKNQFLNVLIVDDSNTILEYVTRLLKLLNFTVIKAHDGFEALQVLKNSEINFVITDIEMPNLNGIELVKEIRSTFNIDELPVLVLSSTTNVDLTFQILKLGGNDFIKKPFEKEEFIIRTNNLLEIYDSIFKYKHTSLIDSLTGAYNRFYLESELEKLFKVYSQKSVAMLDIDFFKKVNDTYGHQMGDEVLKYFANLILSNIRKNDLLIRYGGEEFLIFMPNTTKEEANILLTKIKKLLSSDKKKPIEFTFSAGIADEYSYLSEMIKKADERLYKAKKEGRNRIIIK